MIAQFLLELHLLDLPKYFHYNQCVLCTSMLLTIESSAILVSFLDTTIMEKINALMLISIAYFFSILLGSS